MEENKKTAVALGVFDGLHIGHAEVIKAVLTEGDLIPSVFTFSGASPLPKMKKTELILTEELKFSLMRNMGIERITARDFTDVRDLSAREFVERIIAGELNAGLVVCGRSFRFAKGAEAGAAELKRLCAALGVKTRIIPPVTADGRTVSSTLIRRYIKEGDIKSANKMLGYELMYELPVIQGNRLGHKLGVPTINQEFPEENAAPLFGVYKSDAVIDRRRYSSVSNIGVKPTVGGEKILIETHIVGFDGDLYGRIIRVCLRDFIRPERRFNTVYELRKQIKKDIISMNNE